MDKRNAALTALVVDDSRTIRELVSAMLEAQGIGQVEQAEDGVSAFRAIDRLEKPVDILFCDLAMPGVDGVETLRGQAARNIQAGVVLLSGVDPKLIKTVADMAEQLGLRVLGSVAKPFREEQIAEVVAQYHRVCAPKRGRPALTITGPELDAGHLGDGGLPAIVVLGVSGAVALPVVRLLSRSRIVTNIDDTYTPPRFIVAVFDPSKRELELMRALKRTLDPKGLMNPGKLL